MSYERKSRRGRILPEFETRVIVINTLVSRRYKPFPFLFSFVKKRGKKIKERSKTDSKSNYIPCRIAFIKVKKKELYKA